MLATSATPPASLAVPEALPARWRRPRRRAAAHVATTGNFFTQLLSQNATKCAAARFCPCCGACVDEWRLVGTRRGSALGMESRLALCPNCRSRERQRFSCLLWGVRPPAVDTPVVAYFGPHRQHARLLEQHLSVELKRYDYLADDLYRRTYDNSTIRADVQDIPAANYSFDAVIILHVLEHVSDIHKATTELSRVLVPGGFVDTETPCRSRARDDIPYEICNHAEDRPRRRARDEDDWICNQPDHLHSFSCWYLEDAFEEAGLDCECLSIDRPSENKFVGIMSFPDWRLRCYKPVTPVSLRYALQAEAHDNYPRHYLRRRAAAQQPRHGAGRFVRLANKMRQQPDRPPTRPDTGLPPMRCVNLTLPTGSSSFLARPSLRHAN
ncbi:hypothetical protein CTAYLR_005363 [Chrysophaeum taylorii]|uniref:Methyltransferase type 11 domain-containing protein n=1 Tax=Chrysophaeum taylorii TaxID=2483200 RepID=A0AAD7XFH5_9STRA|nr:hypothetical protein CTAYLR_005363 [Chrysophaeum taylorii]